MNIYSSFFCVLLIFILSVAGCKINQFEKNKALSIDGVYCSTSDNICFAFDKARFVLFDQFSSSSYDCCDTLSYGVYQYKEGSGILVLNSPFELTDGNYFELQVEEKIHPNTEIGLEVLVNNPIEDQIMDNFAGRRLVFYDLSLNAFPPDFMITASLKEFSGNSLVFQYKEETQILEFDLSVGLTDEFIGRSEGVDEISSFTYKVQNHKANLFLVNIPSLTLANFTHIRMRNENIKIITGDHIQWNDVDFKKKY